MDDVVAKPRTKITAALGIPVITSNQALAWYVLRRLGITDSPPGCGRLFETTTEMRDAA